KAFDRVNHEYLWLLLGRYGLQGRFIDWLKTLYRGAESFLLVNGWVGWSFEVGSGVRQGCPLSPLLYAFTFNPLVRRLEGASLYGVPLGCQAPPNGISSGPRHGVSQDAESKSQSAFSPGPLMVGMDLVQD
ncbi:unnamed protein product, partial [Staurois parvus]